MPPPLFFDDLYFLGLFFVQNIEKEGGVVSKGLNMRFLDNHLQLLRII